MASVRASVRAPIRAPVRASVRALVRAPVRAGLGATDMPSAHGPPLSCARHEGTDQSGSRAWPGCRTPGSRSCTCAPGSPARSRLCAPPHVPPSVRPSRRVLARVRAGCVPPQLSGLRIQRQYSSFGLPSTASVYVSGSDMIAAATTTNGRGRNPSSARDDDARRVGGRATQTHVRGAAVLRRGSVCPGHS